MVECVYLHVTARCNLNCKYCFSMNNNYNSDESDTRKLFSILDILRKNGIKQISFSGGEPLLRDDIFELAQYAKTFAETKLATNGMLVTKKNLDQIKDSFDIIRISIDGERKRHDAIRGIGSFDKAIHALKLLGDKAYPAITYTKLDEGHLSEYIFNLKENYGLKNIGVRPMFSIGQIPTELLPDINDFNTEYARCMGWDLDKEFFSKVPYTYCLDGSSFDVLGNGDIYPCYTFFQDTKCLGNIFDEDFDKIKNACKHESPVCKEIIPKLKISVNR